ncbi:MAG TPA: hypothetical protein EYP08_04500 [Pyrodictiaceae archaeon]|nr:hypothetical protein [Pyrodictiaceae archaeon]
MRRLLAVSLLILTIGVMLLFIGFMLKSGKDRESVELVLVVPPEFEWVLKLNKSFEVDVEGLGLGDFAKTDFTCDGVGRVPLISWENVSGAKAYAVIVYDPDTPSGIFYHLIIYNVRGSTLSKAMGEGLPNSGGLPGWYPICPPKGSGIHRYYFLVIAQSDRISPVENVYELAETLKKYAIAYGWSMIVYKR